MSSQAEYKGQLCHVWRFGLFFRRNWGLTQKLAEHVSPEFDSDTSLLAAVNSERVILTGLIGRAVAQAVSLWLPTAAARVRVQAACGVCGGQSGTGAGSPANHSTNFSIIIITRGWHNRHFVAAVSSGLNWITPPTYQLKKLTGLSVME
jgi:hypothetical protein